VDIVLDIGDMIVDHITGEVGLLTRRWLILSDDDSSRSEPFENLNLWAWDIYWTGSVSGFDVAELKRYQPYTESGLYNMIRTGTFKLIKRSEK
jgi:hypothetical protein